MAAGHAAADRAADLALQMGAGSVAQGEQSYSTTDLCDSEYDRRLAARRGGLCLMSLQLKQ